MFAFHGKEFALLSYGAVVITMKRIHLICCSHLDPIWQWELNEGLSAAISTFQSAANLAEDFDYIFCHNEAFLYKAVEKYAPELFAQIQKLVKEGRWHIMGGWHLQPDCNMPSGESIVRQALFGRDYFLEKFGTWSNTAVNFDSFGHNRGLVQILKKCGQDSYLCVRPFTGQLIHEVESDGKLNRDLERFHWIGYDEESSIAVSKVKSYMSFYGRGWCRIAEINADTEGYETAVLTWGLGNHGGGPSRNELAKMEEIFAQDTPYEAFHSNPKQYFEEVMPEITAEYRYSQLIANPGCYTSMIRLKQEHILLENQLYLAEKISSLMELKGLGEYPADMLDSATEKLLTSEFHDLLPGTSVREVEKYGLRLIGSGIDKTSNAFTKAFYSLLLEEPVAGEGEYPIVVFNPYPYELNTTIECEFTVEGTTVGFPYIPADQKFVYTLEYNGEEVPFQLAKGVPNFNDRVSYRKKVVFNHTLKPFAMTRFSMYVKLGTYVPVNDSETRDFPDVYPAHALLDGYVYEDETKKVVIGASGLLESYVVDGKEYVTGSAFLPFLYDDNADPWAMSAEQGKVQVGSNPRPFELMKEGTGVFAGLAPIQIIEDGIVYSQVEAFFVKDDSKAKITYTIYKHKPDVDVDVKLFFGEREKMVKLHIPTNVRGKYIGQGMYGTEELFADGKECVAQRFTAIEQADKTSLAFINSSIYGSSYKDDTVMLSLVRGAGYCTHPCGAALLPKSRYSEILDQGQIDYRFRITVCDTDELEKRANEFNVKPYALNVFPTRSSIAGNPVDFKLELSNDRISMPVFKKSKRLGGYIIRLMNNCDHAQQAEIAVGNTKRSLDFGKYEVKTLHYTGEVLCELDRIEI